MNPREKLQLPSSSEISARSYGMVDIIHPACDQSLLSFPAFSESVPQANPLYGVCHQLVIDACRILTKFASKGQNDYLALDLEGKQPVSTESALLQPGRYYYFLSPDDVTTNYRIVADFRAWKFPERVPLHWSRPIDLEAIVTLRDRYNKVSSTAMSDVVRLDDGRCLITDYFSCMTFHCIHVADTYPLNRGRSLSDCSSRTKKPRRLVYRKQDGPLPHQRPRNWNRRCCELGHFARRCAVLP